ncbi:MAG TPA: AraC family transcriptional regulator [Candidatus Saccharimonadales bacterium]|jgi:AraC-like DNA-binding protein|nr:AraC family transcriptional regulator [Candidatus Saccharimonadales bacterium]
MPPKLESPAAGRLERSCKRRSDSIRFGPSARGIERAEVFLSAHGFEPHRHDVYAVGITTAGVQTFRYRGSRRICLPGQLHVLHPDETHDGVAGTSDGFGYRILYIAPELVRSALGGRALPFVADPVQDMTPVASSINRLLADIDEPISELRSTEIAVAVADALLWLSGDVDRRRPTFDLRAVERAREYLAAHAREQTPAAVLEQVAGSDRFTLARHFRSALGTSPDRYRALRRLELARASIDRGQSLAEAAAQAGFADQSHMTRQFKRAYGLTPASWAALTRRPRVVPRHGTDFKARKRVDSPDERANACVALWSAASTSRTAPYLRSPGDHLIMNQSRLGASANWR